LEVIIESVNNQKKLTYQELADKLGLELARQEWHTVLDPIAKKMKSELGDDYDLTWNVVYTRGPAKDLGRYFSNGGNLSSGIRFPWSIRSHFTTGEEATEAHIRSQRRSCEVAVVNYDHASKRKAKAHPEANEQRC
jgi:hypothetical protein